MSVVIGRGETRVNTEIMDDQEGQSIALLADGGWVVTWHSNDDRASGIDVYQQRYDARGVPVGNETLVNTSVGGNQANPSVMALPDGGWRVVWVHSDTGVSKIYQQRYNSLGVKVGATEAVVSEGGYDPIVTLLGNQRWLVTWTRSLDWDSSVICQKLYDSEGNVLSETAFENRTALQSKASVVARDDGGWALIWQESGMSQRSQIHQQIYNANGTKAGEEIVISPLTDSGHSDASVTRLKDGGYIVAWGYFGVTGYDNTVYWQRFNADGTAAGSVKPLAFDRPDMWQTESDPSVVGLADGGWVIAWVYNTDIYMQRYGSGGEKVGPASSVPYNPLFDQERPRMIALPDGGWVVTWSSMYQDGDNNGVFQQRFTAAGEKIGPTTPTGLTETLHTVSEGVSGSTAGTVVVQALAADQGFTYTLTDDAGGLFRMEGNRIVVADGIRLDYEQARAHHVKVQVKDAPGMLYEKWLTIEVGDVKSENLTATSGADVLKGGSYADTFRGEEGDDRLYGGLGKDKLYGGFGRDIFVFDTKPNKNANSDKIYDFKVVDDTIWLDNAVFKKLGNAGTEAAPAKLKKSFFTIGDKAKDRDDYLIYDNRKGVLLYDADGSGKGKAVEIATLPKKLKMTYKDFFIV